jgi:hypothetical protein
MDSVIESIDQVTPKWLTNVLMNSAYIQQGEVETFSKNQSHLEGFTSERYHLKLVYTENVPNSASDHLFLKIGKPEFFEACKKEIEFYRLAKEPQTELSLLKCYDSAYSWDSKRSHLLLQDISNTHYNPDLSGFRNDPDAPIPLTQSECEKAIECLATVHASWWNNPPLGHEAGYRSKEETSSQLLQYIEIWMASIFIALGDRISPERRRLYETALSSYPTLYWDNIDAGTPLTIIHGDAHLGNFMFPNESDKNHTILLDWQSWKVGVGIDDLAHLMALNWYPNQRKAMEKKLLVHYHDQLLKRGIVNYSWDDCWLGYRLATIWMLFLPILWFSSGIPLDHCWPNMEKSFSAFQNLQCIELLDHK